MKDDRLRVTVDEVYAEAIGRAAYVFAILEWNAIWCCERLEKNYLNTIDRKTAGMIADDFVRLVEQASPQLQADCLKPAEEFKRLVWGRNAILHGKPGTAPGGEQRLFSGGKIWTPEMINDTADEFSVCSSSLNALLYNQLK
jgi:hypothetical protein